MTSVAEQFVGRSAELGSLKQALAELERGRPGALELAGEPGIGKTRLLAELGARADRRGLLVLSGRASEFERELPFSVFVDALDEYVQSLEPSRLDAVDDETRAQLAHVLPSLPSRGAGNVALQQERYRAHRAVCRLLEELARTQPLVLLLDDLHWADSGSLELLGSLLRRPPAAAVLTALTVRPRQLPDRLAAALEQAQRVGTMTRLELAPLTPEEARELLGKDVSSALYAESGGNPFYLEQLGRWSGRATNDARAASDVSLAGVQVPRAVAAALAGELALLSTGTRRVLEGAAVAGDPFEPELAAAAAAVDEPVAVDALDGLLRCDLVRLTEAPRRFRFRHPLVRAAVYAAAPGGWRLGAHERCAEYLAARGAAASLRAHHVEQAGRLGDPGAVAVLREAGDAAARRDPASAARLFAAALRLLTSAGAPTERVELLGALAAAHAAAGQFDEAHVATVASLELLSADQLAARVRLTATCAGLEHLLGRQQEAHTRLMTALDSLADLTSPEAVTLMIELAGDGLYRLDYGSMSEWARRALSAARPLGDRRLIASAGSLLAFSGVLSGAVADAEAARAQAAAVVDAMPDEELAECLDHAVNALAAAELYLDRYEDAGRHAERALAVARQSGQGALLPVLFSAGMIRRMRGRLVEAVEVLDVSVEAARLSGHAVGLAWSLLSRSRAATSIGDIETALATAEESFDAVRSWQDSYPKACAGFGLAAALHDAGEAERAVEVLSNSAGGDELTLFPAAWRATGFELLTRCRLACGQRDEAAIAAQRAQELAGALGLRVPAAMAAAAAAVLALDAGDPGDAAQRALAAAAGADQVGLVIEAACWRMLAGRALAQAGESERAVTELTTAATALESCGALLRRDEADRELRRLGHRRMHRRARPGKPDGTRIESLTERELQIARLIVDRKTTRQIAAELYLSPKTIETHIRNTFHKLGVSSRVEVAREVERADRQARKPGTPL